MTRDEWKNNKDFDRLSHEMNSLFTEWPTPSDTIAGFGGNPDKAAHKQWKLKTDAPHAE